MSVYMIVREIWEEILNFSECKTSIFGYSDELKCNQINQATGKVYAPICLQPEGTLKKLQSALRTKFFLQFLGALEFTLGTDNSFYCEMDN